MNCTIRKANENDFESILGLIKELAAFEKAEHKVTNSVEQMLDEKEFFNCLVVENKDKEIIAMSLYYFTYFTWVGKSLYLDDLYVKEAYRGNQIGSMLIDELFKVAKESNCKRVRWQVLDWNQSAVKFYEKIGATIDKEWYNCDFDEKGIKTYN